MNGPIRKEYNNWWESFTLDWAQQRPKDEPNSVDEPPSPIFLKKKQRERPDFVTISTIPSGFVLVLNPFACRHRGSVSTQRGVPFGFAGIDCGCSFHILPSVASSGIRPQLLPSSSKWPETGWNNWIGGTLVLRATVIGGLCWISGRRRFQNARDSIMKPC